MGPRRKKKKKESFVIQRSALKSSLHLLRSRARGILISCLKSIIYKLPKLKPAGESTKASPKDYVYCRVPGLTHFSYPARDEEWHGELPVSQARPRRCHAGNKGSSPAGTGHSASHQTQGRRRRKRRSTGSKGLTLLSVVQGEVSEARSVLFISPVLASGFI